MKRWVFLSAVALLVMVLAACGSQSATQRGEPEAAANDPGTANELAEAPFKAAPCPGEETAACNKVPDADEGAVPGPPQEALDDQDVEEGVFNRIALPPDAVIDQPGIYFLDLKTGAREGWAVTGEHIVGYSVSDDNRWVSARGDEFFHLLDRQAGKSVRWPHQERRFLGAFGDHLVISTRADITVTGPDLEPTVTVFHRDEAEEFPLEASVALAHDGSAVLCVVKDQVYLVDLRAGAVRQVDTLSGEPVYLRVESTAAGRQARVSFRLAYGDTPTEARFYTWIGERLEGTLPPERGELSPEGTLLAWSGRVANIVPTVVIADARTRVPLFQVEGAHWDYGDPRADGRYHWLADSSGVVALTGEGYRIITREGELLAPSAFAAGGTIFPVPGRADRFLRGGREVINRQGEVVGALKVTGSLHLGHLHPWGQDADVLRVVTDHQGHGGYITVPPDFPLRVVRPPFPERVELVIGLPEDDCLNLRAEPDGPVLTCLPGGTVVSVAQPPLRDNKGEMYQIPPFAVGNGHRWIHVETTSAQQGWVAYDEGNMNWAP